MLGVHICARGTSTKCANHSIGFANCNQTPAPSILHCHNHIGGLPSQTSRMALDSHWIPTGAAHAVRNGHGCR